MRRETDQEMRPRDPIFTAGRYQRIRVNDAVVCVSVAFGLLVWKTLA